MSRPTAETSKGSARPACSISTSRRRAHARGSGAAQRDPAKPHAPRAARRRRQPRAPLRRRSPRRAPHDRGRSAIRISATCASSPRRILSAACSRARAPAGEIATTLDRDLQRMLERRIDELSGREPRERDHQRRRDAGRHRTMEVLAQIGSADFFDEKIAGQVDGTRSRRSPGSTLKPFIYAAAMDQGLIHPLTMLTDAPRRFARLQAGEFRRRFRRPDQGDRRAGAQPQCPRRRARATARRIPPFTSSSSAAASRCRARNRSTDSPCRSAAAR